MASILIGIAVGVSALVWVGVLWLVAVAWRDDRRREDQTTRQGSRMAEYGHTGPAPNTAPMDSGNVVAPAAPRVAPTPKVDVSAASDEVADSESQPWERLSTLVRSEPSDDETCVVPSCIFCDQPVGTVKYLWPEWLCRLFADQLTISNTEFGFGDVVENLRREVDQTVDCICERCSHGWLQRLDDDVSPFLTTMIIGKEKRLSPRQQGLLARWAAKTAAVAQYVNDDPVQTPRVAYEYLRRADLHAGTQVLVGRYDGNARLTQERNLFSRTIDGAEHYLSQSTFVIGKVLIQVIVDARQHSTPQLAPDATRLLLALVPSSDRKIDWPPGISIDDANEDVVRHGCSAVPAA
ncbi:MAG: hypothetical protein ACLPVY_04740 [Acidimicrobiia bacterium]